VPLRTKGALIKMGVIRKILLFLGVIVLILGRAEAGGTPPGISPAGRNLRKTFVNKVGYTRIGTKVKGPGLLITWPPLERKEVNFKRMRLAGATLPSATVSINNVPVTVYPTGAFVTLLDLKKIGRNRIEVVAKDATGETRQAILLIRRPPPVAPSPGPKKKSPPEMREPPVKLPSLDWNSELPLRGLIIAVDPGHGGEFPGAVGPTGLEEKKVNLSISLALARKLKKAGAKVILTRHGDEDISLVKRTKIALSGKAPILISIHSNSAAEDANPILKRGTSVYYAHDQSLPLARKVYRRLLAIGLRPNGCRHADLAVIRPPGRLAILVEAAFLSNPEDEALLAQEDFRKKIAEAVFLGLEDFLRKATKKEK